MPILSSLGSASSHGWNHVTPTVTGGTLTADATYYYRTFTDPASWNQLKVIGGPVEMDVLVVGNGGDGAVSQSQSYTANWNYRYHNFATCNYYAGQCYGCGGAWYCYSFFCNCCDCYYNVAFNYYNDDARTYSLTSGGGGGGGVATGKITVAPGIHLITVASQVNGVTFPDLSESISYAFGIGVYNGASGAVQGANGSGMALSTGATGAIARTPPVSGFAPSLSGEPTYKSNESESWTKTTAQSPMTVPGSYQLTYTSGNNGSGDGNVFSYGAVSGQSKSISGLFDLGFLSDYSLADVVYYGGWGGGAGKAGYGAGAASYSNNINDPLGYPTRYGGNEGLIINGPNVLSNGTWTRPALAWSYQSNNIASSITGGYYAGNVGLYDVDYGIGITALGLKVAGGGMGNRSARTLGSAYGGGYPGDSTTVDPWGLAAYAATPGALVDAWDITPKKNGKPNTGGGGGGGTGGSGVVRVRYLRSAVGG